jgi:hypothetical protein
VVADYRCLAIADFFSVADRSADGLIFAPLLSHFAVLFEPSEKQASSISRWALAPVLAALTAANGLLI